MTGLPGGGARQGAAPDRRGQPPAPEPGAARPKSTGLFGRTKANGAQPETKPAIDSKALAPKPGAKPVNPKKGRPAKRQG